MARSGSAFGSFFGDTVIILGLLAPSCFAEVRTWTSAGGKSTIQAEMLAVKDYVVALRKTDGTTIKVPFANFGYSDRRLLEKAQAEEERKVLEQQQQETAPQPSAAAGGDAMLGVMVFPLGSRERKLFLDQQIPPPPSRSGGVMVTEVTSSASPLKKMDIIFKADQTNIKAPEDLTKWISRQTPEQTCTLRIMRLDDPARGKPKWEYLEAQVTLMSKSKHQAHMKQLTAMEKQREEEDAAERQRQEQSGAADLKRCPLRFNAAGIGKNAIGSRVVSVEVENLSSKKIIAFQGAMSCFDRFDDPVKGIQGTNEQPCISQKTIPPGEKYQGGWALHFRGNAAKVKVVMTRIKFADGSEWKAKEGEEVAIWAESPE